MSTQYRPNGIAYTGYDVLPDEYLSRVRWYTPSLLLIYSTVQG